MSLSSVSRGGGGVGGHLPLSVVDFHLSNILAL